MPLSSKSIVQQNVFETQTFRVKFFCHYFIWITYLYLLFLLNKDQTELVRTTIDVSQRKSYRNFRYDFRSWWEIKLPDFTWLSYMILSYILHNRSPFFGIEGTWGRHAICGCVIRIKRTAWIRTNKFRSAWTQPEINIKG